MDIDNLCINCFKSTGGEEVCMHCGCIQTDKPKKPFHLKPHTRLGENGRYVLGNVINSGGFAIIYKAYDLQLQTIVAIKELFPAQNGVVTRIPGKDDIMVNGEDKKELFDTMKEKFLYESRIIAHLETKCESIIKIFGHFEANNTAYMVMEYLDGINLRSYLKTCEGPVDFETTRQIMVPIMQALQVIHEENIIYRNISPDNIFICQGSNKIKLIDFSSAQFGRNEQGSGDSVSLKIGYAAPELYLAESKLSVQTDIYSTGAVWYAMLTGTTPEESAVRLKKDSLVRPSKLGIRVPVYGEKAVMKALALRQENRFETMELFIKAVFDQYKAEYPEVELRRRRVRKTVGIMAIFVLLIAGVVGAFAVKLNTTIVPFFDSEISVWYVDRGDAALNERWQKVEENYNEYVKNESGFLNSNVNVKFIGIPEDEYDTRLSKAFENDSAPDVYQVTNNKWDSKAGSLEKLYENLDSDRFSEVFLNMKSELEKTNKIAVCYDMPVLFVSKIGSQSGPEKEKSVSALLNHEDKEREYSKNLVCDPDAILFSSYCYGYTLGKNEKIVKQLYDASKTGKSSPLATFMSKGEKSGEQSKSSSKYYIGMLSKYYAVYDAAVVDSRFDVTALTGENSENCVVFPEVWSISDNLNLKNERAAIFLLYYLINNSDGQDCVTKVNRNTYYAPMLNDSIERLSSSNYGKALKSNGNKLLRGSDDFWVLYDKAQKISSISTNSKKSFSDVEKVLAK